MVVNQKTWNEFEYTPILTTEVKTAPKTEVLKIEFLLICLKFHWIKEVNM